MMSKFKKGDTLIPIPGYPGFLDLVVDSVDDTYYTCKIINGTVTIPIKVLEANYKLKKKWGK